MSLASSGPEQAWRARLTVPNYHVSEAAYYAGISTKTVVSWQQSGTRQAVASRDEGRELSYLQLIEVAVVATMRKGGIKLPEIRAAREYMRNKYKSEYPFAEYRFRTDGKGLFLSDKDVRGLKGKRGFLIRPGHGGQTAWPLIIGRLKEFEYERRKIVVRWHVAGARSAVVIDPRVAYGAPHVRGIATWIIKGRWEAGQELEDIADDFGLKDHEVSDAVRFERIDTAAPRRSSWH
jgi:uncharacterized protein (DUF433 family)